MYFDFFIERNDELHIFDYVQLKKIIPKHLKRLKENDDLVKFDFGQFSDGDLMYAYFDEYLISPFFKDQEILTKKESTIIKIIYHEELDENTKTNN